MLSAVLARAIEDAVGLAGDIPQHEKRNAQEWLRSKGIEEWGFLWVCDNLDIDPEAFIYALRKYVPLAKKGSKN